MLAKTLSREGFLAFLESRPADEEYRWYNFCKCPAAMYAKAAGVWNALGFDYDEGLKREMLREFSDLAKPYLPHEPNTYGACARRVRQAIYAA